MNYFITVDANGNITGLFRDDYTDIPQDAIPVSFDDGEQLKCGFYKYVYSGGAVIPNPAYEALISAEAAQEQADAAALTTAKADATIQYLVNHTPAEVETKVRQLVNSAGVTNLATAQSSIGAIEDLLVRIGIALSVAAKDRLR